MGAVDRSDKNPPVEKGGGEFASTSWTLVLAAGGGSRQSREALESLCARYWYPLYAYLRRRGHPPHEAEDLTQGFFLMLLCSRTVARARRDKGRFRSFLLSSLQHYVSDEKSRARAVKRGGGRTPSSLDWETAEARYRHEPAHELTPERLFDRRWALTLINQSVECLHERYRRQGKDALFVALKGSVTGEGDAPSHARTATELGMSEAAVKVAIHRLRRRLRELLRAAVADTVAGEGDVEPELRELLAAVRS